MNIFEQIFLAFTGFIAGLIDAVAGGGGLITVPALSILMGPGPNAIGTNKVAAVFSSFFALLVYMRAGHLRIKGNRTFALVTGIGAFLGALTAPLLAKEAFRWILIAVCPVMLWIVFKKDIWVRHEIEAHPDEHLNKTPRGQKRLLFLAAGLGCGFYDGIAGPGGGTLMFLSLFLVARLPLLMAMATAKVANLSSASLSLASFALTGHVNWAIGSLVAAGISIGAAIGAKAATRWSSRIARYALLVIASLLLIRLIFT